MSISAAEKVLLPLHIFNFKILYSVLLLTSYSQDLFQELGVSEQELEQEAEAEETISQDLLSSQPSTTSAAESKVVPGPFSHLLISCPLFGVVKFSLTTTLIFVSSLHADSQATPSGTPTKKPKPTPDEKKALLEAKKEAKRKTSARSEHFLPALTDLITCMVLTHLELEKQLV